VLIHVEPETSYRPAPEHTGPLRSG
jgi:hypothetical protein